MKHPIDMNVGLRIRQRRWMLGMTQQHLAQRVGIKFQQIQKYESGANRVSASRLFEISQVLEVPISYFFDGLGEVAPSGEETDVLANREALELVRAFYSIPEQQRKRLFELARALSHAA
jgi:transcriptional regulator with XRE-family HTH domain